MIRFDDVRVARVESGLHERPQLPRVARPRVAPQHRQGRRRKLFAPRLGRVDVREVMRQQQLPVRPRSRIAGIATCRHPQPEVQVRPEAPLIHQRLQIAVRRHDHPHVHPPRTRLPDRRDLSFAQRAQQDRLPLRRQLPDLVQEHDAAVGRLEDAPLVRHGAGKASLPVAEQLADAQLPILILRAVHADERRAPPRGQQIQRAREQFLARSCFAGDQHGRVRLGEARHAVQRRHERGIPAETASSGAAVPTARAHTRAPCAPRRSDHRPVPRDTPL